MTTFCYVVMITTKVTALMIATAVLGVGSPLAAMAQVPVEEDGDDTTIGEVIGGIRADVQDRLDEDGVGSAVGDEVERTLTHWQICTGMLGPHGGNTIPLDDPNFLACL